MLKQATSTPPVVTDLTTDLWAFFRGGFVPLRDANVSVMTHALNYGTAVFEGIRAYWNVDAKQLYALDLVPHFERIVRSAALLYMQVPYTAEQMADFTVELLRRDGLQEDTYVRPLIYKSSELIGVRLHNLDADFTMFAIPFGKYIDTESGVRAQVSSWRRTDDNAIPARGKITGAYVNSALAKSEAQLNGFDEAIVLTQDGHVSEGSAENLFIVRDGTMITPAVTDNVLEGITRARLLDVAGDLGIPVIQRSSGPARRERRTLAGARRVHEVRSAGTEVTGAQVSAVVEIDRRLVSDGRPGPITTRLSRTYFEAVRGRLDAYHSWLTPIY